MIKKMPDVYVISSELAKVISGFCEGYVISIPATVARGSSHQPHPESGFADAVALYGIDFLKTASRRGFYGEIGEIQPLVIPAMMRGNARYAWTELPATVVLTGLGTGQTVQEYRAAGAALAHEGMGTRGMYTTVVERASEDEVFAFVEAFLRTSVNLPRGGVCTEKLFVIRPSMGGEDVSAAVEAAVRQIEAIV